MGVCLFARYCCSQPRSPLFFFFNDTATTEIYTLSLHDALPISAIPPISPPANTPKITIRGCNCMPELIRRGERSEEHTSELQSPCNLVCRLLLEKKKTERCRGFAHPSPVRTPSPDVRHRFPLCT